MCHLISISIFRGLSVRLCPTCIQCDPCSCMSVNSTEALGWPSEEKWISSCEESNENQMFFFFLFTKWHTDAYRIRGFFQTNRDWLILKTETYFPPNMNALPSAKVFYILGEIQSGNSNYKWAVSSLRSLHVHFLLPLFVLESRRAVVTSLLLSPLLETLTHWLSTWDCGGEKEW